MISMYICTHLNTLMCVSFMYAYLGMGTCAMCRDGVTEAVSSPIQEAEEEADTVAAAPAVSGAPGGAPNLPAAGLQAKPGRKTCGGLVGKMIIF